MKAIIVDFNLVIFNKWDVMKYGMIKMSGW